MAGRESNVMNSRQQSLIICRVVGGLGNQLFCYSAARRLALVNGAELALDDKSGFAHDHLYQRRYQLDHFCIPCRKAVEAERLEPFSRIRRHIMRRLNRNRAFESRSYIQQEGMDFDPRLLNVKPRGRVYIEGYWQGLDYFVDVADTIRRDLRMQPPSDAANLDFAARIRSRPSVAVHVRFFDTPNEGSVNNAPADYYRRAIATMEALEPDAHYFIFSDQPFDTSEHISLPAERTTFVRHNIGDTHAYADLWLMTLCRHFIIANSTFSWWGAWLAEHPSKRVIAPGFEMRHGKMWWGFDGLLPDAWIKL